MLSAILVGGLLLLVNALYVAAEFSAVAASPHRVAVRAERGHRGARLLLPILRDPAQLDRYVSACQVGITISSLALGAVVESSLATRLVPLFEDWGSLREGAAHTAAVAIVLLVFSLAQLIVGEQVPKSLALEEADRVAEATVFPVTWTLRTLAWFIGLLNGSARGLLGLVGAPPVAHHVHSAEEIDLLLAESGEAMLEAEARDRLRMALRLGSRTARKIMVPRPEIEAIDAEASIQEVLEQALRSPFTRLPVYRGSIDDVLGAVHTRDLVPVCLHPGNAPRTIESLICPVVFVPESMPADRLIAVMREHRVKLAIVKDEFGGTAGLVTLEDVLSEVLGDVADEHRRDQERPERLPDGRVRLPGSMRVDDVEPWVGVAWEGEAATVGGLVTETLGRLPRPGERLEIASVPVEVERVSRVVDSVLVTPAARGDAPAQEEAADG